MQEVVTKHKKGESLEILVKRNKKEKKVTAKVFEMEGIPKIGVSITPTYEYEENNFFTLKDILELFKEKPYLKDINSEIIQKKVCNSLEEELDEAIYLCKRQDLNRAKKFIEEKYILKDVD